MQTQTALSPEGRSFLYNKARQCQQQSSQVTLVTNSQHSNFNGTIEEVNDGGLSVREAGTKRLVSVTWDKIDEIIQLQP